MAFDLHHSAPVSGIIWEKVLRPMLPRLGDTLGSCAWTPSELLIPVKEHTGAAQVVCDQNGFTVQLDVKHFNPDELMVKVKGDYVVVEGKHEQKKDGSGLVTREFNQRYRIPNEVDAMNLECAVSPEGMLVISAPLLKVENAESSTQSGSGV